MGKNIYCISGLGADEKIFSNLHLEGYTLKHVPWLRPLKKESLAAYATRMSETIDEESPILLGVSFGGMLCAEIARQRPVARLILISSLKSTHEMPYWMRLAGRLRLNHIVPIRSFKFTERLDNYRLGAFSQEEIAMARHYRQKADPVYMEWSINQILNWRQAALPVEQVLHLHGSDDKIFPVTRISNVKIIPGGTHFMIYNRAGDVSEVLLQWLNAVND